MDYDLVLRDWLGDPLLLQMHLLPLLQIGVFLCKLKL